jgi:hypothetical protein
VNQKAGRVIRNQDADGPMVIQRRNISGTERRRAMSFTTAELDVLQCDTGHETNELILAGACHPGAVTVLYRKLTGDLQLNCAQCGKLVIEIAVASERRLAA